MNNEQEEIAVLDTQVEAKQPLPIVSENEDLEIGSHIVTLKVNESTQFFKLPKEIQGERKMKIGSTWKKGTKDIIRGLTEEQERRYLPRVIGIMPKSEHWEEKVRDYWRNISISVLNTGIDLEVGGQVGTYFDLSSTGDRIEKRGLIPINISDYITYNFCKQHKAVAVSEDELLNVDFFDFFIEDKAEQKQKDLKSFRSRKSANFMFQKIIRGEDGSPDVETINWILQVAMRNKKSTLYNKNTISFTQEEKEMALEEEMTQNPNLFMRIAGDKDLKDKAFISKLVQFGVIDRDGNVFLDNGNLLGGSLLEVLAYTKNPNNSKTVNIWKERLKQAQL